VTKIIAPNKGLIVLASKRGKKNRAPVIGQVELEMLILRRRELMEQEEQIAVALSKGVGVEPGVHKATLVPERKHDDDSGIGTLVMKLVVFLILLAVSPYGYLGIFR
jgi:hypothetical protein